MVFLEDFFVSPTNYITNEDLTYQRVLNALNYAFNGYGIDFDDAIAIINARDTSDMTPTQISERDMLRGLVDNLISFSVAEEFQVLNEMSIDRTEVRSYEEFLPIALNTFAKFNKNYAFVENMDIAFALSAAAKWVSYDDDEIIQYNTQGDERVRASHQIYEGLRYRKKDFPEALITPIDWGCRCYLTNIGSTDGRKLTNKSNINELINTSANPIFKNNVAVNGIMFSEFHPYFAIAVAFQDELSEMVNTIKERLGIWKEN